MKNEPPGSIRNNLALHRQKRGLSVAEVAKRAGVSRQTVYAMESASYVPNTAVALHLARILEVSVEDLFCLDEPASASLRVERATLLPQTPAPAAGTPVQLCRVDRRLMASAPSALPWYLPTADAVLLDAGSRAGKTRRGGPASVQLFHGEDDLRHRILIAGCDPGISVLARHVQRAGVELVIAQRNSSQALQLLKQRAVHVAGTHLRDQASGESNLPAIEKLFTRKSIAVIALAMWEEGIVLARGNPKSIHSAADFARADVSIANREPGAGSRALLDTQIQKLGIPGSAIRGYDHLAGGHLAAAWQVYSGAADACIATRAAARAFGLEFIALASERYDLAIRAEHMDFPPVQALLDTVGKAAFRRELEGLGGYDTRSAGLRVL
ncbi:MAG: substrate-binding domain-containing protein [Bryobacteraceae bacterium]